MDETDLAKSVLPNLAVLAVSAAAAALTLKKRHK